MDNRPRAPHGRLPGWYADPNDRNLMRWWDGGDWGRETRPGPREHPELPGLPPDAGNGVRGARLNAQSGGPPGQSRPAATTRRNFRPVDERLTRVDGSPRYVGDQHHTRDESRNLGMEVADRSVLARTTTADIALQEDNFSTEEMRRSALARLTLSAIFGLSILLYVTGFALGNDVLRLVALVGILFFGVGTAPLQLSERASLNLRLCIAGVVGLSVPLLVGTVLVLVPVWQPVLAAIPFGAVAVWVHIQATRNVLAGPIGTKVLRSYQFKAEDLLDVPVVCSLLGTLLWLAGMAITGHVNPGVFGFLPKSPVYWYLGLILLIAGIVQARGESEWRVAFGVLSLLAALTLTPAVVYGMPRTASAAKHIDFVQYILQMHSLSPAIGIFRAYSGLFNGTAWLCDLSGMHNVTGIATYFPFFIDIVLLTALRFFLGRLTVSHYRIWIMILLFILVNSIGADYFSPQAVGFSLGIGVFGLALDRQDFPGLGDRERVLLLLFAGCAMAVTHELSPFIVGGVLAILVLFRMIRVRYVPLLFLVPAILWGLLHWGSVSQFASLSDFANLANFETPRQPLIISTPGLQRLSVVAESSDALLLGLVVLIAIAAVGFMRTRRNRAAWAYMINPGIGLVLVAVNPYGGEGIFRAALFGIPWLAAIGTQALSKVQSPRYSVIYGVIATCLLGTFLVSMFGLDNANVIRPADFKVMQTYENTAAPDSYLLDLSDGNNVLPTTVGFPIGNKHVVLWGSLITQAQAAITQPTSKDVDAIAKQYYQYAKKNDGETSALYAYWSLASIEYSVDYGHETLAQAVAWRNAMIASPDWEVVDSDNGSYLLRLNSKESAPAASASITTKPSKSQ